MAAPEYDSYRKLKVLGEGAFGKALLVDDIRDGTQWVMKQIDLGAMPQKEKEETIKEAKILQFLDHPNIVKFKDVFVTKKGKLCIVMEYADGGDLAQKIKNQNGKLFSEAQILDWFTQISLALKHVHDRKIIHRDLKGQNIFLTQSNRVKLGDFGIARVLGNTLEKAKTQVGTPYYLSPEIIESKPYSQASDIWSLGAILYELCTLKPPFLAESLHFLALKIIKGQYNPIPNTYSKDMNNLVKSLLQLQPTKRPNINQILKSPIVVRRIQEFLSESVKKVEFAHTIIHKQKLNYQVKLTDIKVVDEDLLRPPPNLLKQNSQSQQQLPPPIPQQKEVQPVQQQIQPQQYVPVQQFVPKQQLWNQQPLKQEKPQVQQQQNVANQQQQRNNQPVQNQPKNAQIRNEKPLVQQVVMQQPKQYQQQQQQQPRRDAQKPTTAVASQKQRNSSRNRVVDAEKQEQERKRMQQIKYEADLKRKEEEKRKFLKLQQEEEAKKKAKEEIKRKRELQQKEMRDDLQKKRQQIQQQQSQPNLYEQEPVMLVKQHHSQPQHFEEQDLEEYNSDEDTNQFSSEKHSAQKLSKYQEEHNQDIDIDNRNMDYGLKQEENQVEIDALQQAILCKEYEKVLEEVQEANSKVNQIEDAQFEKNRQRILDQFEVEEAIDFDDLEDDDDEFNLTKTNELTNQNAGLDYFKNPEALRSYLEQVLGKDKFQKAYTFSQNELQKYSIEQIESKLSKSFYFKELSYLTQEEIKQFIPLLFQLVIVENV